MEFSELMLQVTRPYWSPVHPTHYIQQRSTGRTVGWGLCYPEDIGAFNLMWVMAGIGGPPEDYMRYSEGSLWVCGVAHLPVGRWSLRNAAATMSIDRFSRHLDAHPQDTKHLDRLKAALRLKV